MSMLKYNIIVAQTNLFDIRSSWHTGMFCLFTQADWALWPAAQALNFSVIPAQFRVLYVCGVTLCWNTFLSYYKHKVSDDICCNNDECTPDKQYLHVIRLDLVMISAVIMMSVHQTNSTYMLLGWIYWWYLL